MSHTEQVIAKAVREGVTTVAANPAIAGIQPTAIYQTTQAVTKAVAPVVDHLTNNEPWYRSRVVLGSVATIVSSLFALWALVQSGSTDGELYAPLLVAILGAGFAIYGRIIATKPLGS